MPPIVNDRVAWSVGLSVGLSHSEPCKTAEAIEMPFALRTRVGPGKYLLHIADRFGRILYCVHSTQYSLLLAFGNSIAKVDFFSFLFVWLITVKSLQYIYSIS